MFGKDIIAVHSENFTKHIIIRGLSKKYPTSGGEKYISYVTGLEP